jgi:site-specific recombinase XerC
VYQNLLHTENSNNNPLSLKNRHISNVIYQKGMKLEKLQKITEKHKQLVLEIRKTS